MRLRATFAFLVLAACSGTVLDDPSDGGPIDSSNDAGRDAVSDRAVPKDGGEPLDADDEDTGATEDGAVDAKVDGPTLDGGADASLDASKDVMTDVKPIDAGCTTNAGPIAIADASMGDGASTTSECLSCARSTCALETAACEADCTCREHLEYFFSCVKTYGSTSSCGSPLRFQTDAGGELVDCVIYQGCADECVYP